MIKVQTSKCQTRRNPILRTFSLCSIKLAFKLAVASQFIVYLRFATKAQTRISTVAIFTVRPTVRGFHFAVQIQFITVFVIYFCGLYGCRCHNAHHH